MMMIYLHILCLADALVKMAVMVLVILSSINAGRSCLD
jgi:hypothetical protein